MSGDLYWDLGDECCVVCVGVVWYWGWVGLGWGEKEKEKEIKEEKIIKEGVGK